MKFFKLGSRPANNANQIPQVRAGVAHVIGPGKLRCQSEHLMFETVQGKQLRIDIEGLEEVLAYGSVTPTAEAIHLLHRHGIACTLLDPAGLKVRGRIAIDSSDRVLQRLLQFQAYEDASWQLSMAKGVVVGKLMSTQTAARHYQRQGKKLSTNLVNQFGEVIEAAQAAGSVDQLRGLEGHGAALWFGEFGKLFGSRWKFAGRNRRPPRDPINALLSLGYMQLYRRCTARLEAAGYEASLGALHEFRSGRMNLACDLMEPLRIPVVDRWVVGICQQGIIRPTEFVDGAEGGIRVEPEKLVDVLGRFEEWWHQGMFRHILDEEIAKFRRSLQEHVSQGTTRAAKLLKQRVVRYHRGDEASGKPEVYEP
ncbi:MAG: CRISPR-associated endonuclease Cas1 [Planctomycetaceae bacterium]|nr:MAG: CRISPR-associated endonuclease Cas1 [Planctomycetaceae bacterium]